MKRYVENARRFGELDASAQLELFFVGGGLALFVLGLAVVVLFEDLFLVGAIMAVIGLSEMTIVSQILPDLVAENAGEDAS